MANKEKEIDCLEKVLNCYSIKGEYAHYLRNLLKQKNNQIDLEGEKPDIIIDTGKEVIGIEHCQVDVLFKVKKKKAQSMNMKHIGDISKLIEKYKDNDLLDEDIRNGSAIEPVLDVLKDRFEYRDSFSYRVYLENFDRVCREHNAKCDNYRLRLDSLAQGKRSMLGCLIDIPYPNERKYSVSDKNGIKNKAINGIPLTKGMLNTIEKMVGFDFVILCMHCFDKPSRETKCFYFEPSNIYKGIKQQQIDYPIYSFELESPYGLGYKAKIDFAMNSNKTTDEQVAYTAIISKK